MYCRSLLVASTEPDFEYIRHGVETELSEAASLARGTLGFEVHWQVDVNIMGSTAYGIRSSTPDFDACASLQEGIDSAAAAVIRRLLGLRLVQSKRARPGRAHAPEDQPENQTPKVDGSGNRFGRVTAVARFRGDRRSFGQ